MTDESLACRNCAKEIGPRDHGLCEECRREMLEIYYDGDGDDRGTATENYGESGFSVFDD